MHPPKIKTFGRRLPCTPRGVFLRDSSFPVQSTSHGTPRRRYYYTMNKFDHFMVRHGIPHGVPWGDTVPQGSQCYRTPVDSHGNTVTMRRPHHGSNVTMPWQATAFRARSRSFMGVHGLSRTVVDFNDNAMGLHGTGYHDMPWANAVRALPRNCPMALPWDDP